MTQTSSDQPVLFTDFPLAPEILQVISEVGYEAPSPIQAESIPPLLDGRDVLGMAQTGTGKTAAFALPLLSRIDLNIQAPQMLVLAPTRELAIQVAEAMQTYARHLPGFHVLPVYGGQSMSTQLRQLRRGAHVVVGTPGRIQDHLRRGTLQLGQLKSVVLDEADEMLRMGFIDDVNDILNQTPEGRQVALFSATMPEAIARIARTHLKDPVEIRIKSSTSTVKAINQRFWQVSGMHKLDALTRILEVENFDAVIVFVRTKTATTELAEKLEARGYAAAALNGDMNQVMREKAVDRLKRGSLDIVVATDVAARGLDVSRMSHVINYDIPYDTESYVHRIGRTGRAGRSGEAILFITPREKRMLRTIEKATGQQITQMRLPSHADVANKRTADFKNELTRVIESEELEFFETLVEEYQSEHDLGLAEVAAALAFLAQKERPLLPAADDVPEPYTSPDRGNEGKHGGNWVRYAIAVGREHGVNPKNIVGALANEVGIKPRDIGAIRLFPHFTTIELPAGLPDQLIQRIANVHVLGIKLAIAEAGPEHDVESDDRDRRPPGPKGRKFGGKGGGGKREFSRGGGEGKPHRKGPNSPNARDGKRAPNKSRTKPS